MTDTPELKPCPFCGGKASFERIGDRRQSTIVACEDCGARHECGETHSHGTSWNTRTPPKVMPLEWESFDAWTFWAKSVVGTYTAEVRAGFFVLILKTLNNANRLNKDDNFEDISEAKAAAQADYERRILEALDG